MFLVPVDIHGCILFNFTVISSYFNDNYKIKQNTTMNVNKNQKHWPILHYITQAKSRTTKITVMHDTLTHFNSKSVKNPYFLHIFSV